MSIASIRDHERPTEALMGERVHNLLWRAKITQTAFAQTLGLSQTALSRKLHGDRAFTLDEILMVSGKMNVSLEYLFGLSDDEGPSSPNVRPTDYRVADSNEVVDMFTRELISA